MKIGITGGIGCGKSTVSRLFEEEGFRVIDCDAVAHRLMSSDQAVIEAIRSLFGDAVIGPNGGVLRPKLGEIVFADSGRLKELEAVLHPAIRHSWEGEIATDPEVDWAVEIPLLFEKNLQNRVDFTVCVYSDAQTQLRRLEEKGMDRLQAEARIERQLPVSEKSEKANFTLLNDGSLDFLADQVKRLVSQLRDLN